MKIEGYSVEARWSEEDNCFVGYCPALLFGGGCHDDSEEGVYDQLKAIIVDELDHFKKKGEAPPEPARNPARLTNALPARAALGLDQRSFAQVIGVALPTYRRWEQNGPPTTGPAAKLLALIERDPKIAKTMASS